MLRSIWKEKKQNSQEAVARHQVRDNRGLKTGSGEGQGKPDSKAISEGDEDLVTNLWKESSDGCQSRMLPGWWRQFKGYLNPGKHCTEATAAGSPSLPSLFFPPTIFNQQHFLQLIKSKTTVEVTTIIQVTTGFPAQYFFFFFFQRTTWTHSYSSIVLQLPVPPEPLLEMQIPGAHPHTY